MATNTEIVFEVEYENHAWGYVHSGILIMPDGVVTKYSYPPSVDLKTKSLHAKPFRILTSQRLDQLHKLMHNVTDEPIKDFGRVAFDAGTTTVNAYVRQPNHYEWKKILLAEGGVKCKVNPSAKNLVLFIIDVTDANEFIGLDLIKGLPDPAPRVVEPTRPVRPIKPAKEDFCIIF